MSSWYSAWLPGLPSINLALPSSIQRRFISFILKKSLGHLLRPGQLDTHQIDSQIGSGYVQVSDLELDNEAINKLLYGLPVELRDGSISSVTARIPWPNPLTSTLGFSLNSLRLTFHLLPASNHTPLANTNLADSVASVAESFIHDELTPREEATLRESFHPDLASSVYSEYDGHNVPGGLDPFLQAPEDDDFHTDVDPAGVSIFATLIERLLARFEFDAVDTKITLIHPGHTSLTVSIPEIRYGTEVRGASEGNQSTDIPGESGQKGQLPPGETRTVSISGVTVSMHHLRSLPPILCSPPSTPSSLSPTSPGSPCTLRLDSQLPDRSARSVSPASSSSSLDEETQFLMSQSLAFLPPRPPSPTSSIASSMYQSAISTAPTLQDHNRPSHSPDRSRSRTPSPGGRERVSAIASVISNAPLSLEPSLGGGHNVVVPVDETILSFGNEPIIIQLTTPPPVRVETIKRDEPSLSAQTLPNLPPKDPHSEKSQLKNRNGESLQLSVTIGTIACALRAWHIRGLLDLIEILGAHHGAGSKAEAPSNFSPTSSSSSTSILGPGLEVRMGVRGLVVIVLPSLSQSNAPLEYGDVLKTGFFKRPLVPPQLPHGYLRLHLEGISSLLDLNTRPDHSTVSGLRATSGSGTTPSANSSTSITLTLSLSELSAFAFHPIHHPLDEGSSERVTELFASPLLITDPHLPAQYSSIHRYPDLAVKPEQYPQLPIFDVTDWTDEKYQHIGMKISNWRSKAKHKGKPERTRRNSQIKVGEHVSASPDESKGDMWGDDSSALPNSSPSAIHVTAKKSVSTSHAKRDKGRSITTQEVEVNVAPLHIFVDLGQALSGKGVLAFFDEIVGSGGAADVTTERLGKDDEGDDEDEDESDGDEADSNTPPTTPRARSVREQEKQREKERRRLEKLVLEDLDLDIDYRVKPALKPGGQRDVLGGKSKQNRRSKRKGTQTSSILIKLPMIRVQVRCPPPLGQLPRSGAFVLDLHDVSLATGSSPGKRSPRFADPDPSLSSALRRIPDGAAGDALLVVECNRLVIASSLVGSGKATTVLSLGPLNSASDEVEDMHHVPQFTSNALPVSPLKPRIVLTSTTPKSSSPISTTLVLSIDIPSVYVTTSKGDLDGLQYWADDASQLMERIFGGGDDTDTEKADSRDTSLIGSRFFAKSRNGSGSGLTTGRADASSEIVVKIAISEASVKLMLPREHDGHITVRPFDIFASDLDLLIELKPEGKDETVLTLGVMNLTVTDTSTSNLSQTFLSLTSPRSLSSAPKPLLKLRFTSLVVPETTAKESRIKLTLWGFTYSLFPDFGWITDLGKFFKAPPGAFESVIPSERTRISLKVIDGSIRALAPTHPGAVVFHLGNMDLSTDIVGDSPETSFYLEVPALALLAIDDLSPNDGLESEAPILSAGISYWKGAGYALLAEIEDLNLSFKHSIVSELPDTQVVINRIGLRLHLCADTLTAVIAFAGDLGSVFKSPIDEQLPKPKRGPTMISEQPSYQRGIMSSVDEHAFKQVPEVGPAPDMINDDLPTNLDYLDESFGTAAGLRELRDDDLDEFDVEETEVGRAISPGAQQTGVISKVGGETIKILRPEGLHIVENYFDTLQPDAADGTSEFGETTLRIRVYNGDLTLFLYDGYDWAKTRKTIEEEVKDMRRRLAKIRQLVASGQTQDPSVEETSALLFNSVYIGLEQDVDELEPGALIAAIDEELKEDVETASQSSWQSLKPPAAAKPRTWATRVHGKRLTRSRGPSIEFRFSGVTAEVDQYKPGEPMVSRTFATIKDLEILDHIKTSTWKKFLTELRSDSRGNVRETDSNMVRVELRSVHPVPGHPSEEARLRAKILPLRLYVDQDALDFLKKFFSFKDVHAMPTPSVEPEGGEIYFQLAEIFPVDLKLDYKPRRVDYRALREGKTIELMNFFHFDGAEMTLRHITLSGITGWPRVFDMLNDLWTPDVKATQLVDVISGVAPIRSVVNVGSGVADLVLLPIAQYKKDGRIVRGVQKGTTAFVKSTAMEAIKLGARLATGTQVILEQAEGVLGGQFSHPITAETLQVPLLGEEFVQRGLDTQDENEEADLISKYAEQPMDIREGMQSAYKSLQKNFNSAAQTILAVPMEVYERSGNEGPVRAVIRAVPIAVLKPMIGASEAVSKTLLGLHNSLDPNVRHDNEAKYKHR